ncbi:Ger(x)C family spore germination protein [Paenibacillus sp. PL2-23]|uniref:Ger(x)C family spore germination protein n=1 Tax=Paenibacillus sp. PL2-23 TaxID=2100729 RepID=UPI0030F987EC
MRNWIGALWLVTAVLALSGCADRTELDNSTLITIVGLELMDNKKLAVTGMVLDFNEESKSNEILLTGSGKTLRDTRSVLSSKIGGEFLSGKLQIVLVGKSLLQEAQLLPYLDVIYRDAKISNNALVVTCECSVRKLMETKWKSQPILTEYIRKLIEASYEAEMTVRTTLQNYHYMQTEEGMTPAVSEIKPMGKEIAVTGTALLSAEGKYALHLTKVESLLLHLLQKNFTSPASYTATINGTDGRLTVSYDIKKASTKVKTSYRDGQFHFLIRLPLRVEIAEIDQLQSLERNKTELETALKEELETALRSLLAKLQSRHVDPIGLGIHARAFQYNHWKEVSKDWGAAFSQSDIELQLSLSIDTFGVLK